MFNLLRKTERASSDRFFHAQFTDLHNTSGLINCLFTILGSTEPAKGASLGYIAKVDDTIPGRSRRLEGRTSSEEDSVRENV